MEQERYIKRLEDLLIFMCQKYKECEKIYVYDAAQKGQFQNVEEFPLVQGTTSNIAIRRLAELDKKPPYSFDGIYDEIKKRRK